MSDMITAADKVLHCQDLLREILSYIKPFITFRAIASTSYPCILNASLPDLTLDDLERLDEINYKYHIIIYMYIYDYSIKQYKCIYQGRLLHNYRTDNLFTMLKKKLVTVMVNSRSAAECYSLYNFDSEKKFGETVTNLSSMLDDISFYSLSGLTMVINCYNLLELLPTFTEDLELFDHNFQINSPCTMKGMINAVEQVDKSIKENVPKRYSRNFNALSLNVYVTVGEKDAMMRHLQYVIEKANLDFNVRNNLLVV